MSNIRKLYFQTNFIARLVSKTEKNKWAVTVWSSFWCGEFKTLMHIYRRDPDKVFKVYLYFVLSPRICFMVFFFGGFTSVCARIINSKIRPYESRLLDSSADIGSKFENMDDVNTVFTRREFTSFLTYFKIVMLKLKLIIYKIIFI